MPHPARFSAEIIDVVGDVIEYRWPQPQMLQGPHCGPIIWDPFAGTGERLAGLARDLNMYYGGTEIEECFIFDDLIVQGDATDPATYPTRPFIIFTSPVYPNGMADSWKMSDGSKRYTYRSHVVEMEGEDRELHDNNMGRYGYRGTTRHKASPKRAAYWRIAREAVACWGSAELVILNVSDFRAKKGTEPLVQDWRDLLAEFGWGKQTVIPVATKRMRNGANADERVDIECVVVAERLYDLKGHNP